MKLVRVLLVVACATALPAGFAMAAETHEGHGLAAEGDAAGAFAAANNAMMTDMMVAPSGNADVDFVKMMIPHHRGAIEMAKIELRYGTNPEMRALAEEVIAAQEAEIAEMEKWLAENAD